MCKHVLVRGRTCLTGLSDSVGGIYLILHSIQGKLEISDETSLLNTILTTKIFRNLLQISNKSFMILYSYEFNLHFRYHRYGLILCLTVMYCGKGCLHVEIGFSKSHYSWKFICAYICHFFNLCTTIRLTLNRWMIKLMILYSPVKSSWLSYDFCCWVTATLTYKSCLLFS